MKTELSELPEQSKRNKTAKFLSQLLATFGKGEDNAAIKQTKTKK